jgi:serine/threonine-protein kinase
MTDRPVDARVLLSHVRDARRALGAGVMNDPALTARMRTRTLGELEAMSAASPGTATTVRISPAVAPPVEYAYVPATDVPTPHTPLSASTPVRRSPSSPEAPPTRTTATGPARPHDKRAMYRRRRLFTLITLVTVIALVTGVGAWWMLAGRYTQAPQLVSMTEADARTAAADAHVVVSFSEDYSETVPAGQIVSTDPTGGSQVLRDSTVAAVVSKGPERYTVPTLAGLTQDEARQALTGVSLAVGQITQQYSETVASGVVLSASQKAGALLKKNTPVDLVVSKGPRPITIVDYTGKPVAASKAALEKAGFKVVLGTAQNSSKVAKDSIVSQSPASGSGKAGDTITLVPSLGPVMVSVPNVRAMDSDKAKITLQNAGFTVKITYLIAAPLGLVVSTNPEAGTKAPQGSTITMNVA